MTHINARNVHQALPEGCRNMLIHGQKANSRNGKVLVHPGPFVTTYRKPEECVMFWPERDANPFLHLFEALWMLSGRDDVAYLSQFSKQISEYSDDGVRFNAAYGFRWRKHFGKDQVMSIIVALIENPECRRQVLTMWDATQDLNGKKTKDVPCNTQAYFQILNGALNMTVVNRSNDMIWGAYGANAVHFSFLLQFMAAAIGVRVGSYTQFSANNHVYEKHFELLKTMDNMSLDVFSERNIACRYSSGQVFPFLLVDTHILDWLDDLDSFLTDPASMDNFVDPFFSAVALPMWRAHRAFRNKDNPNRIAEAINELNAMPLRNDWRQAATEWLLRRKK